MSTILTLKDVGFSFPGEHISGQEQWIPIFTDISFSLEKGQIIGLVGESGCGKTTLGNLLVNYFNLKNVRCKSVGNIYYHDGETKFDITAKNYRDRFNIQPIQMIFQNPKISLDLKMKAYDQLREAILIKKNVAREDIKEAVHEAAKRFKIEEKLDTTPGNMSGGERRRLGLAKIIATEPKIIIADEPVASLDVSIKHEIMDIILGLKRKGCTLIIISHDIDLIKKRADKIFVMDDGKLVEQWNPSINPVHSATLQLLSDSKEINEPLKNLFPSNNND